MPPVRWFSTIVVALLTALATCGGVLAQGSNSYTVTDVDVDVTAADAVQARQQGIAEARRKAAKMLVERLGMKVDRVAIELNRDIVPRDRWGDTVLNESDRLEVVHFVGGGIEATQELS